jgi:hypothetical protein
LIIIPDYGGEDGCVRLTENFRLRSQKKHKNTGKKADNNEKMKRLKNKIENEVDETNELYRSLR